jgi:ABC-type sugar transport system ATPase subunit
MSRRHGSPHHEAGRLISALQEPRSLGQTIVYVSHRLPEVLDLADDFTVLRDARWLRRDQWRISTA